MPALRLSSVGLDYPDRPGVLADVSLEVGSGELVVLRGRSGSGKSSIVSLAAGLHRPTRGTVEVAGIPMPSHPGEAAKVRAAHVGLVFQHLHLLAELTVAENVELPLRLRGQRGPEARGRIDHLLHLLGVDDLAARLPERLSGGEQQRVAIARALAVRPALLLVDEPTSALDYENARTVVAALQQACKDGAGVLVATHDPVFRGSGRVLRLQAGRLAP